MPTTRAAASSPSSAAAGPKDPAILVHQFDGFYILLSGLAERLRRGSAGAVDARSALVDYFERQEAALRPLGAGFLSDVAMPARRAMAAMVDQLLGHDLDWPGRGAFANKPFAEQLFGAAGTDAKVRQDYEHLLAVKGPSKAQVALARVFLEALGLGLRRPFDGTSDLAPSASADTTASSTADSGKTAIGQLEHRLFAFIYPQAPPPEQAQLLFPEAYAHTVASGERTFLPSAKPWWRVLAVAALLLLILSWPIWRDATAELRTVLENLPTKSAGSTRGS